MIIGWANGCFDGGLHAGHHYFLSEALKRCDRLHIGIDDDLRIRERKGDGRPSAPWGTRAKQLLALSPYDRITTHVITDDERLRREVRWVNPDIIFRGWDQEIEPWLPWSVIRIPRFGTVSTTSELEKA